jgi:hypothetical protein
MFLSTIWVVMGSTGEYSDRREWLAVAYADEVAATRHADKATERALLFTKTDCEHGNGLREACDECHRYYGTTKEQIREWMGDLDPAAEGMDYTGSDYVALPVQLRSAP